MLLLAKVCKPTRCSSTGYQYSELLFFSCLYSGQLKLHNGVLGAGIIDYIPATFTNSDTPSTNNAFLLKATFCYSSRILGIIFYSSIVLNQTIRDRVEHQKTIPSSSWVRPFMSLHYFSNKWISQPDTKIASTPVWLPDPHAISQADKLSLPSFYPSLVGAADTFCTPSPASLI